ncbi:alpha/beta hydrolase [Actinobacteria bacterium YIM 96077]|uniref:Alpha/beta hydrolase n=1 Tax=Phytoactinopolyspora halophila TaxID=1981511 RepID=A0A329QK11_9ACTN|nr:alpha/beta hydrolase [Phytoactinopolyspora halophila]AYY12394.1 alpha/beta hydrolase [Actinobacteria bacterium YIM 96077]RAW12029.1 alpha/beta hydrolase [Phytoactinopolyspora halophila]
MPATNEPANEPATNEAVSGVAAGVPFIAVPPAGGPRPSAPAVVAWHMMDAPRTEAAFAAALPMNDLDAWRIYMGLPLSGSRLPEGGVDELMRLGYEDAVLNLQGPVVSQAVEEFPDAFATLRSRFDLGAGPIGLVGGSIGAAVALQVLLEQRVVASAAVLVSPLIQLRQSVDAMARQFGFTYTWSDESSRIAERLDVVARAAEFVEAGEPAVLLAVGEQDDADGFRVPAAALREKLRELYADDERIELVEIAGMGHALAEEPGVEPAPQTRYAAEVDRQAVAWLRTHLG